jgi:primosomal protein N' (replication factor Y)
MYYEILVGSQRYHGDGPLTYASNDELELGSVVRVPLSRHRAHGIVLRKTVKPSYPTKSIETSWSFAKLPQQSIDLLLWMHAYYPGPFGQLVELFIPPSLGDSIEAPGRIAANASSPAALPSLTTSQSRATQDLVDNPTSSVLLHGVTGSGKTRIYIERALEELAHGKSVMMLTPEIGLTQPLAEQLRKYLPAHIYSIHSGMTPAKRREQWLKIANTTEPVVIVGPRSALFMPVSNLGLIVVDEVHDAAYKQDQSPHYLANRVAAKLRMLHGAQLILGSATPSVTEYYGFETQQLPIVSLTHKAVQSSKTKQSIVVDSKDRSGFSQSGILSNILIESMRIAIAHGEQTLLFLNKRGSARLVLCQSCGWQAVCPKCDVSLTFHADTHNLRCHSCDVSRPVPVSCPDCGHAEILFSSVGTKAVEQEAKKLFPGARISRFDGDTTKSDSLSTLSDDLHAGNIDIIIGTQTITKGFDLPKLSVVGVVQADASLTIPDFSASERTFQLLAQISGRIGRGHRDGTLVVQTFNPANPLLLQAINENYNEFYKTEIAERQRYKFPPFTHLMTVRCTRSSRQSAIAACNVLKLQIRNNYSAIQAEGPSPRFIEKQRGKYTWQLILRSSQRANLVSFATSLGSRFSYDIDPTDLL